ncbi:hypothetical protein, partial [Kosakonia cowanii]|uniref:hypothetical protein n=1 Tax=Kosakonia cowanii TaxID=208223 RepID=UPI0039A6FC0B
SVRHPWRPDLVIPASVRRFQRGHNPVAVILQIKTKSVSLKARFCRPDKAKPPSGSGAVIMPDGAYRLSGLRGFSGMMPCLTEPGERNHSTNATYQAHCRMARTAYPAYAVSAA